ncbi:MAG TPA: hypothetical protein VII30_00165, partial [Gemmatimonadaceae bacterium]
MEQVDAVITRAGGGACRIQRSRRWRLVPLPKEKWASEYLVAGKRVSMRLWIDEPVGKLKAPTTRDYETVGYV